MADRRRPERLTAASSSEALKFVRELQQKFLRPEGRAFDDVQVQEYLKKFDSDTLRSIAMRVAMDVLKRPPPEGDRGDGSPAPLEPASAPRKGRDSGKRTTGPSARKPRRSAR